MLPNVCLGLVAALLLVWSAGAQVLIDPTAIFTPDAPVKIVLDFDTYTRVLVRERTNVQLNCSIVRDRFIANNEEIDQSRVTVRWLSRIELPQMTIQQMQGVVMDRDNNGRIRILGEFNEILNITDIRLPKLAVDGTTGEYSCEVCHNQAEQCVNSTIPVLGRNYPPDIDDGIPDEMCTENSFFRITSCKVGTNYCVDPDNREEQNDIQLLCNHNSSARPTPIPRIAIWFINGVQVSSSDGSILPNATDTIRLSSQGRRLRITNVKNATMGNYTCQLTNIAGRDTATTFITDCRKDPPDIRDGDPDGMCMINPMLRITTCDIGTNYAIDPDNRLRSLRLQCQQNASAPLTPEPLIGVWHLNGVQVSSREDGSKLPGVTNAIAIDEQGTGLRIVDFENAPRGNYTCYLVNHIGTDVATTIISDLSSPGEPPEIITDPSPGGIDVVTIGNSACFNDSILINCSLRAGTRPVMYEWTRDGKAIPPPSPAHILHVNRPGNYSCMVMNSFGRDFASSVVRGHPVVDLITTVIGARNEGGCARLNHRPTDVDICPFVWETVTFLCQHDADRMSSPPSILTPYGPGPSQFYLNNCSRSLLDGHYSCSSSNECGTASRSVRLQVFDPAKIVRHVRVPESTSSVTHVGAGQRREAVYLLAGGHAVLYCPSSGAEPPRTRWFKRGDNDTLTPVSNTNRIVLNTTTIQEVTTLVLSLPKLRKNDFGEYVCIAHNRAGRDEARVTLREIGVWKAAEWSMCAHRRRVTCIGSSSGQQVTDEEESCSDNRPSSVSRCICS